jgi:hypothetical protein
LDLDLLALYDDFEGRFPGTNWTASDSDPGADEDYWGYSSYRSSAGSGSAWSAGTGNRSRFLVPVEGDFEDNTTIWTLEDKTASNARDYWGISTYRAHNGNSSLWCAQVGTKTPSGSPTVNNSEVHQYDDWMDAYATTPVNLAGYSTVTLDYYYLLGSINGDFLRVGYNSGSWVWLRSNAGGSITSTTAWTHVSLTIPTNATMIGFLFYSNSGSSLAEGAYIDDVTLSGVRVDANGVLHTHDTNQNSTMFRGVDLSGFGAARMDYQYWLDTEAPNDVLEVGYYADGAWTYLDARSGFSGGWQPASVPLPLSTTLIGFRFTTDDTGFFEGAYIDELRVWGIVMPLRCAAQVSISSGYEAITDFNFSGGVADGRGPFNWTWQFGDGGTSSLQNPTYAYPQAGTYTPSVSVQDSVGQSCSVPLETVTLFHDTTTLLVTPRTATFREGESFTFYGADGQGHAYDLNWSVDPPSCGEFNVTFGPIVGFTARTSAGGLTCTVAGSVGDVTAYSTLTLEYDTSVIHIEPPSATLPEGKNLKLTSTDRYGNTLAVLWSASCGRLSRTSGNDTVYSATTQGGVLCTVTASFGTDRASATLNVIHDSSLIKVKTASGPVSSLTMVAGSSQPLSVEDLYGHPFEANWSVEPPECGSFDAAAGSSNGFTAARSAGGLECTLKVLSELSSQRVNLTVTADTRTLALQPRSATVVEGSSQSFSILDANGYPVLANWSLSPTSCGVLDNASGRTTTFLASQDAAGLPCKVTGRYGTTGILAPVTVVHGPPLSIVVTASTTSPLPGSSVTLTAAATDAAAHNLTGLSIAWSAPCGIVLPPTGATVSLAVSDEAASTTCTVMATSENTTGSVTLHVAPAGPFVVTVTPSTISGSGPQTLTAVVKDSAGRAIPDAPIVWTATCGQLSQSSGPTTTFTPPAQPPETPCTVKAEVDGTNGASQATLTVAGASSSSLPIIIGVAVAAGAGAAGFLVWRKRKQPASPEPVMEEVAPEYPPEEPPQ